MAAALPEVEGVKPVRGWGLGEIFGDSGCRPLLSLARRGLLPHLL